MVEQTIQDEREKELEDRQTTKKSYMRSASAMCVECADYTILEKCKRTIKGEIICMVCHDKMKAQIEQWQREEQEDEDSFHNDAIRTDGDIIDSQASI